MCGTAARTTQSGGAARGVQRPLGGPPRLAAGLAGRAALDGGMPAASGAKAGGAPGLVAPAAAFAPDAPASLGLPATIQLPLGPGLRVTRALARPARFGARPARGALFQSRRLPAVQAQSGGAAFLDLAAGALALVGPRPLGVPSRHPGRPEPCVAGPAGAVALLIARLAQAASRRGRLLPALGAKTPGGTLGGAPVMAGQVGGSALLDARLALAAMRRGRALPALQAKALGAPFSGLPVIALQVPRASRRDILLDHHGALAVRIGIQTRDARPARAGRTSAQSAAQPRCLRSGHREAARSPHSC